MRHVLVLLSMPERHMRSQVQAYLKVSNDPHPQYDIEVRSRLKRGNKWVNKASKAISECCDVQKIRRGATWQVVDDGRFTQITATLGSECREWTKEAVSLEIELLIEENLLSDYLIVYTDGSVHRGVRSGWGYTGSWFVDIV